jgi:hypothetical protein
MIRISASSMTGGPNCLLEEGTELAQPGMTMPGIHSAFIAQVFANCACSLDVITAT